MNSFFMGLKEMALDRAQRILERIQESSQSAMRIHEKEFPYSFQSLHSRSKLVDECAGSIIVQTTSIDDMEYLQSHEEMLVKAIRECGQTDAEMLLFWPYDEPYVMSTLE